MAERTIVSDFESSLPAGTNHLGSVSIAAAPSETEGEMTAASEVLAPATNNRLDEIASLLRRLVLGLELVLGREIPDPER